MKPNLQRRIQRYGWDKAAPYYDSGWQRQLKPAQLKLLNKAGLKPGESVLDVSCGTGLITQKVTEAVGSEGSVTGIDLSEQMIEKARTRLNGSYSNCSFRRMDAEDLIFEDITFDAAICSLGLMYFPRPERAIDEMFRVVKPGGRVSALVWGARQQCGWASIFPITDRRVKSDVCPLFFRLGIGDALEQAFMNAGFTHTDSCRFSKRLEFRDDEEACVAAFLGGAVALAYQKFDNQTREEVHAEYLDSIRQYKQAAGYSIPGEFVIVTGTR
ncbi:class I SAM-dependent methyltransferase [Rhodohalobacter mucosus]|uniref:Dimethylmenaquinone methyltransferase n=1 Tax=Rhodohalobacter mucosus TaxID=2079485 RepID=A0A316TUB9_9BACT|nr:class I SAM-dependent methyltransferase [Rhodohalobacter mucosus]PWN08137.1 dimethylmenaquinone methyltransferase [Rhodohalobacter mucosus]